MHTSYQRFLLISVTASFFMWGLIATVGPLSLNFPFLVHESIPVKTAILVTGPAFLVLGNVLMGFIADRIGRKKVFIVTMTAYALGIIIVVLATNFFILLPGLALSQFGVGGEEPSSLSLVAENTDADKRPFWLTILTNMDNIGSALMAGLFFIVVNDLQDRAVLLIGSLLLILVIVALRRVIPESQMWLKESGNTDEYRKEREKIELRDDGERISQPSLLPSFVFLGVIAVSQYLTFGLMAYVLAPIEFPNSSEDDLIIFVALLGSSVAGFIAAPLISRGRKNYTLLSFLFGTVTMVAIFIMVPYLQNMVIFLPLLFANMFMSEFAYASRSVLEPELYGTRNRSALIGLTRLWPMIAYPIFTFYTSSLNLYNFLLINVILWALGLSASVYWFYFGIETKNANIDYMPRTT